MLNKLPIIIIDPFGIQHKFIQIVYILLDNIGDIFQLSQLVAIVIREHAFWAHDRVTEFAEIFNLLVLMLEAIDFTRAGLCDGNLRHLALHTHASGGGAGVDGLHFGGVFHLWEAAELCEDLHDLLVDGELIVLGLLTLATLGADALLWTGV